VSDAIRELVDAFDAGDLVDREEWHTVKSMVARNLA
jgi:BMFP domain-containing protein YqiC